MAQTPQQRRANEQFARAEALKRGKPVSEAAAITAGRSAKKDGKVQKAPISRIWVYMLLFVVCGGIVFELIRLIYSSFFG